MVNSNEKSLLQIEQELLDSGEIANEDDLSRLYAPIGKTNNHPDTCLCGTGGCMSDDPWYPEELEGEAPVETPAPVVSERKEYSVELTLWDDTKVSFPATGWNIFDAVELAMNRTGKRFAKLAVVTGEGKTTTLHTCQIMKTGAMICDEQPF